MTEMNSSALSSITRGATMSDFSLIYHRKSLWCWKSLHFQICNSFDTFITCLYFFQIITVFPDDPAIRNQSVISFINVGPCPHLGPILHTHILINSSTHGQNGRHFADDILIGFSWMKRFHFWLKFHWSMYQRVQLIIIIIIQHWFR